MTPSAGHGRAVDSTAALSRSRRLVAARERKTTSAMAASAALNGTSDDRLPAPASVTACISSERTARAAVARANAAIGPPAQTRAATSSSARFTAKRPSEI